MYRDLLIRTQDLFMLKHEKSYESETLNGDYLEETMFWETPDKSPCSSLEEKNVKLEVDVNLKWIILTLYFIPSN